MARRRWLGRGFYLLAGALTVALVAACGSGNRFLPVTVTSSEGRLTGRVTWPDGAPAAGIPVTAEPPSLVSPATVATGGDGRYTLRAPAGPVTLTAGSAATTTATVEVTAVANETTTAPDLVVEARAANP